MNNKNMLKVGEKAFPLGLKGMEKHLIDVKKPILIIQ